MSGFPMFRSALSTHLRGHPGDVPCQKYVYVFSVLSLAMACFGCTAPSLTREVVLSNDAPEPIGPYSQGIKAGGLVFLSGQSGGTTGGIEEQTARALDSLKAVALAAGMSMGEIVSTTVYLKDVNDFAKMNAVYAGYFKEKPPARATVQVARLPRDSLIQISAIAAR